MRSLSIKEIEKIQMYLLDYKRYLKSIIISNSLYEQTDIDNRITDINNILNYFTKLKRN